MANRVDVSGVKAAFDTDLADNEIELFIVDANLFVTEELVGKGLSDGRLAAIEKYLACHFCALKDPRLESENIAGEWSFKVQGKTAMHLDATFYGQQAKLLDTTGTLDELGANPKKATLTILKDVS